MTPGSSSSPAGRVRARPPCSRLRRSFCRHIGVLPEAASILFGGGFPRRDTPTARACGQRAIFRVQTELERMAQGEREVAVALCDRGTLDGLAYCDGDGDALLRELGTTRARELARYAAVIHLRTPAEGQGYNHRNPMRTESAEEAAALDARIVAAWQGHPRRMFVENHGDFMSKLTHAVDLIRVEVPPCCRRHQVVA
jgi:hypothetical protein